MKKLLLVALLMLALVFTVVACNNNEPADTTAGETTVGQVPGTAEPAPETEAPETPTEAPEVPTEAPEVPTEAPEVPTDAPVTQAPVVTTEPETEAPVDPADPVYVIDAATLAGSANKNAATIELNDAGYASFTAVGGDPWVLIAGNIGAMPEYMAVRYRTNTTQNGEFFLSNGANPEGGKSFVYNYNANGEWNLMIFHLPTVAPYMTDNTVGHIRFDFYTGGPEDGAFMDVEYIAFFNTAEYAQAYDFEMHKAPMWDESGIVTHLSFDQLYTGTGNAGNGPENFFTPGQSGAWDKIATLPDFSVDTLTFWGWVGVIGEIGQFGYQVNGGAAIYDDAWTFNNPAEGLINHCPAGTDNATRMKIAISLAGLDGENTIRTLYKAADGTEACLAEFTVILPVKPKDIKNTFEADVNANDVGTGLGASDLANYFTVELPLGSEGVVANGEGKMYSMTAISDMYADVNGKYFIQSNNLTSANGYMFVRGYKVVNSDEIIEKFDPAGGFYKINNYYETDSAGQMGGAGIYARIEGGVLHIVVKYYNAETVTRVGNKIYSTAVEGTELTMADDGEVVSILVNGKKYATIALNGSTTYADINEVQPKNSFAASAVVTLADGTTETIENTLIADTCECQVGVVVRSGHFKFDTLKVGAYSAIEIPEFEAPETEAPETEPETEPAMTPEDIVNAAYALENGAALEGTYTLTGVITTVNTPYSEQYKNITVTIQIGDLEDKPIMCYRLKGEGAADLKVSDTITVTGSLKNYNGTIEFDAGCTLDAVVPGEGPAEPVYTTPEEIVNAAYALEVGASLTREYTLTGVITSVDTVYSEQYKNVTVTMVVGNMATKPIQCFRLKGEGADVIAVGDTITVTGILMNYNGKIEFNSGCILNSFVPAPIPEPVPGSEELPLAWDGSYTVDGTHDVWFTYTATESGIWVITTPAGNYVSGLNNFNKVDNAYSINVTKGDVVKFNLFGATEGVYTSETVDFTGAALEGLFVDETVLSANTAVLPLVQNAFSVLTHVGSVEFVGTSVQFVYNLNGVVSDPVDAIEANGFTVTVPADALELGGNLIKIGAVIDGVTVVYFWEYTVVLESATETETAEPETETAEPETEAPVVPEEPTVNTLDFSTFAPNNDGDKSTSYVDRTNPDGWTATGARIEVSAGDSADIITEGTPVIALNGKTTNIGTLKSPVLAGGIQSLSFNLAYFWKESSNISLTLTITPVGGEAFTTQVVVENPAEDTAYEYVLNLETAIEGEFTIEIVNNCLSNNAKSNKDRVAIWNFSWLTA